MGKNKFLDRISSLYRKRLPLQYDFGLERKKVLSVIFLDTKCKNERKDYNFIFYVVKVMHVLFVRKLKE